MKVQLATNSLIMLLDNIQNNYIDKSIQQQKKFRDKNRSFLINNWSTTSEKMDKNILKKTWNTIWTNIIKHDMVKHNKKNIKNKQPISW